MPATRFGIALLLVLGISFNALAGVRCPSGKLANKGDKTTDIITKCGDIFQKRRFGYVTVQHKTVNLERWTYIPEKGRFIKYLEFHNGILVEISNGARVK